MDLKVTTSLPITFEKVQDVTDSRFTDVRVFICHTKDNLNGSYFDKKVIEDDMIPSLSNIPILGYIKVDNTNESDFSGHEERLISEKDGIRFEYLGRAYGLIPENNDAHFEMKMCDDGVEREFLVCNGLIWNKFTEAVDIFDRDEVKSQSMELQPDSIKGKFEKDGFFHFTNAKFEGLCILGDDVTPAMTGSVIEKFSMSTIKTQLQEMIQELNIKFSLQQTVEDENYIDQKGGQNMPENIKNQNQFSLTSEQLKRELKNLLSANKTVDDWGYEYSEFYLVDCVPEESLVIAQSWEDYCLYAFSFAVDGDKVSLDVESKKRYKVQYVPMELDGVTDPDAVIDNFAIVPELVEYKLQVKEKEMEQKFSAELEAKEKSLQEVTTEAETKFNALQEQFTSVESELNELKEFKSDSIKKEREDKENALYEKLASQLSEEEITQFKEKSADMTIEELEKEMFALVGQKVANSTVHNFNKTTTHITMSIDEGNKDPVNAPYGGVVEKYIQK